MEALIVVDVQVDFCQGGALPAPKGNEVIPVINKLMDKFEVVVASRDSHPEDSKHFSKWPKHCVEGTKGSDFHPDLNAMKIQKVFLKGTDGKDDGYSAFEATNDYLSVFLKDKNVDMVFVSGLTTEFCVKNTVIDSINIGFKTFVITDAIEAVKPGSRNEKAAIQEMKSAGAVMVHSANLQKVDV